MRKPEVGDTVWYTVGAEPQQAEIVSVEGTLEADVRILTGPQAGITVTAPWGVIKSLSDSGEV